MSNVPLLLVQQISQDDAEDKDPAEIEVVAIAVYAKNAGVPVTVTTRRLFDGDSPFYFPTEVTEGAAKTRIVYRHTLAQWRELLETLTRPSSPDAIKQLMIPMLLYLCEKFPESFGGINFDRSFEPDRFAEILPAQ